MSNIVIANFINTRSIVTDEIWQWNYGQILRIQGLDLPRAVEIHFSVDSISKTRIGTTIDGVTDVAIPDSVLEHSGRVKVYLYMHTGADDGETEYVINIPVKARAEPESYDADDDMNALREAIALLQDDLEQTAGAKAEAVQAAADAAAAKTDAEAAKNAAEQAKADAKAAKESVDETEININHKAEEIVQAGLDAEARIDDANKAAEDLEDTIAAIGFYIDDDGDLCQ